MLVNVGLTALIALAVFCAVRYLYREQKEAAASGNPGCVGCSACKMAGKCKHKK